MTKNKLLRLHFTIPESEVAAIDDWGFSMHLRSRSEAIRRLIEAGLNAENAAKKQEKTGADKSR